MSSNDIAIRVSGLSKCYHIYEHPGDRLRQFIVPRLSKIFGKKHANYFREFWALKNISFEIKKGETVGIIGKNGSGKSTLLQIICGTLSPTEGIVETSGRIAALLELGSGFNPEFTGRENVYLNASVLGLSKEETDTRFDQITQFAEIGEFIDQPVKTYSSGMMVRLAFAVIAHVDADILIIDEALAVGDAFFTQKCMRFLRGFMEAGTVLFVSHDTASVQSLCNLAFWIDKGVLIQSGAPKDICERYLEAFYASQQGPNAFISTKADLNSTQKVDDPMVDPRLELINKTTLRNDIELIKLSFDDSSFGAGGAKIISVGLLDGAENSLHWIVGGEYVILQIKALALSDLQNPIMGFTFKDRLGQGLFGDNTFISYLDRPVECKKGEYIQANFGFQMPRLTSGNYSISVAIADGTQSQHIQHHWIHDAVQFKSESTSVSGGIIGIPMHAIKLEVISE